MVDIFGKEFISGLPVTVGNRNYIQWLLDRGYNVVWEKDVDRDWNSFWILQDNDKVRVFGGE